MEHRVLTARPYESGALSSRGQGEYMLVRQHQFPDTYDMRDTLTGADHDRCLSNDYSHARRCLEQHLGTGEGAIGSWVQKATDPEILAFIQDLLKKTDAAVTWTGYRVLGTVNRASGQTVWTLELFAKHPASSTAVYTGHNAPNVARPAGTTRPGTISGIW